MNREDISRRISRRIGEAQAKEESEGRNSDSGIRGTDIRDRGKERRTSKGA